MYIAGEKQHLIAGWLWFDRDSPSYWTVDLLVDFVDQNLRQTERYLVVEWTSSTRTSVKLNVILLLSGLRRPEPPSN